MQQCLSADDRVRPPLAADEATTLRAFLDYHRGTIRWKCAGLTQQQLAQPLAPSDLTSATPDAPLIVYPRFKRVCRR